MNWIDDTFAFVLTAAWQGSLLLLVAWLMERCFRRKNVLWRRRIWLTALALMPLLPIASSLAIRSGAPIDGLVLPAPEAVTRTALPSEGLPAETGTAPAAVTTGAGLSLMRLLGLLYFGGLAAMLILLGVGVYRLRRWTIAAMPITDQRVVGAFETASSCVGLRSPCFLMSGDSVPAPLSTGWFNHRILIPKHLVRDLTDAQLRDLLLHETVHIRQSDPLVLGLLGFYRAVFFFHPLVWIATRRFAFLSEQAADATVVETTREPVGYTKFLIQVAETMPRIRTAHLASGMALGKSVFLERAEWLLRDRREMVSGTRRETLAVVLALVAATAIGFAVPLRESPQAAFAGLLSTLKTDPSAGDSALYPRHGNQPFIQQHHVVQTLPTVDETAPPPVGGTTILGLRAPIAIREFGQWDSQRDERHTFYFGGVDAVGRAWVAAREMDNPGGDRWIFNGRHPDAPGAIPLAPGSPEEAALQSLFNHWIAERIAPSERASLRRNPDDLWSTWTRSPSEQNILIGLLMVVD